MQLEYLLLTNIVHNLGEFAHLKGILYFNIYINRNARVIFFTISTTPHMKLVSFFGRFLNSPHRRAGRGGGQLPPPQFSQIYLNYSGNFYLRVGQSLCSCFVSLIFLIFSFYLSLAPCIKTHTKT